MLKPKPCSGIHSPKENGMKTHFSLMLNSMAWSQAPSIPSSLFPPYSSSSSCIHNKMRIRAYRSPPFPSKPIHNRKNYLRQKLLKTLTQKPNPSTLLPHQTLEYANNQLENPSDINIFEYTYNLVQEEEEDDIKELDFQSPGHGVPIELGFVSSRSVLNLVLCFFGLFVIHTVCAVWVFGGSIDLDEKSENSLVENSNSGSETTNGKKIRDFLLNKGGGFFGSKPGGLVSIDNSEIEQKILQIRVLAREARASERKKSHSDESVIGDEDGVRIDIRKEVDSRLMKLRKSLHSRRKDMPSLISFLNGSGKIIDGKDSLSLNSKGKAGNSASRKHHKLTGSSARPRNKPKGFPGLKKDVILTENNERNASGDVSTGNGLDGDSRDGRRLAVKEEESLLLRDEVLKRIVLKVMANEEAGREPYSGFDSEEMSFFRALERKFEREGESAIRWMEMSVGSVDLDSGGNPQTGKKAHLEESVEPEMRKSNAHDVTNKLIERSESEQGTSVSSIKSDGSFLEDSQNNHLFGENGSHDRNIASQISEVTGNPSEGSTMGIKSKESEAAHFSQSLIKAEQDTPTISEHQTLLSSNGTKLGSHTRRVGRKSILHKVKDGQADVENNLWWLNLPYVFVRLLCSRAVDFYQVLFFISSYIILSL
ncbi:ABC subfamily C protein isoform X2 [Tasmannia lanceolata]|uniref:ABC subfamily C protein isoform X2 n=1 Tax=Tasmannia lanceolata TaxID=3420 RepID=UPI004063EF81